jgi:hypothetical protein
LLPKVPDLEEKLLDRIFQLFLLLKPLRIRSSLALGLQTALTGKLSLLTLDTVCNLNKLKRGAADLELDYDTVIKTI